jgi:hypothetical protein
LYLISFVRMPMQVKTCPIRKESTTIFSRGP